MIRHGHRARLGAGIMAWLLAEILAMAPSTMASAAPAGLPWDAILHRLSTPLPRNLHMRRDLDQDSPATARPARSGQQPERQPEGPTDRRADQARAQRLAALPASTSNPGERTTFHFNLGFGMDGGEPSGVPSLTGVDLSSQVDYARLRVYSFGDAILGSRGILAPSLSTYLAAQFRFDQEFGGDVTAVPSAYDVIPDDDVMDRVLVRSGYAEVEAPFDRTWLQPLFVRAGRQYRYGPVITHFDGLTIGYNTRVLSVDVFAGQGVDSYGFQINRLAVDTGGLAGLSLRLDLRELVRAPLILSGNVLGYHDHGHADAAMSWRWSRDITLQAGVRSLDGNLVHQHLNVRARLSEVTMAVIDLENRGRGDWMYDALAIAPVGAGGAGSGDSADPRRYLDLGEPLPRTYLGLRAGTVLLDNIDLLLRAAAAIEHRDADQPANTFAASYLEAGLAFEVRVRRTLALGGSILGRTYDRTRSMLVDSPGPDRLPQDTGHLGEQSFVEAGGTFRYTLGARKFNATGELYMRGYDREYLYVSTEEDPSETRGGGRFAVEGWAGERLRLKAEYDVSSSLAAVPELRGIKSLRILLEGRL